MKKTLDNHKSKKKALNHKTSFVFFAYNYTLNHPSPGVTLVRKMRTHLDVKSLVLLE